MLKLIIADDERIIRETISTIIDWKQYDIELVGLCKNGLEAYDMILDETPDIVLTDIRMPGMDGLELIRRISETDLNTQFIILSGYGEFEYAKMAMKYGIRHYLLKPCSEAQILESIQEIAQDCYKKNSSEHSYPAMSSIRTMLFLPSLITPSVRNVPMTKLCAHMIHIWIFIFHPIIFFIFIFWRRRIWKNFYSSLNSMQTAISLRLPFTVSMLTVHCYYFLKNLQGIIRICPIFSPV